MKMNLMIICGLRIIGRLTVLGAVLCVPTLGPKERAKGSSR